MPITPNLLKVTFLGTAETTVRLLLLLRLSRVAVRLGIMKSWSGDVWLSTSDLILGLFLLLTE